MYRENLEDENKVWKRKSKKINSNFKKKFVKEEKN